MNHPWPMAARLKNKSRVNLEMRSAHGRAVKKNKSRVNLEPSSAHGCAVNKADVISRGELAKKSCTTSTHYVISKRLHLLDIFTAIWLEGESNILPWTPWFYPWRAEHSLDNFGKLISVKQPVTFTWTAGKNNRLPALNKNPGSDKFMSDYLRVKLPSWNLSRIRTTYQSFLHWVNLSS